MYADQMHAMQQQLDKLALFYSEMKQQLCDKASQLTEDIISSQIPKPRFWRSMDLKQGKHITQPLLSVNSVFIAICGVILSFL